MNHLHEHIFLKYAKALWWAQRTSPHDIFAKIVLAQRWTLVQSLWYGLRSHVYGFKRIACENECIFIILPCDSPFNGIHDSFPSQYPWLLRLFSSSYTWWALWLMFARIILGKGKAKEKGESSGSGALG